MKTIKTKFLFLVLILLFIPICFSNIEIIKYCTINDIPCTTASCDITFILQNSTVFSDSMTMNDNIALYIFTNNITSDISYFISCCQDGDCATNQYILNETSKGYLSLSTCPSTLEGIIIYGIMMIFILILLSIGLKYKFAFMIVFSGIIACAMGVITHNCHALVGMIIFVLGLFICLSSILYFKYHH